MSHAMKKYKGALLGVLGAVVSIVNPTLIQGLSAGAKRSRRGTAIHRLPRRSWMSS